MISKTSLFRIMTLRRSGQGSRTIVGSLGASASMGGFEDADWDEEWILESITSLEDSPFPLLKDVRWLARISGDLSLVAAFVPSTLEQLTISIPAYTVPVAEAQEMMQQIIPIDTPHLRVFNFSTLYSTDKDADISLSLIDFLRHRPSLTDLHFQEFCPSARLLLTLSGLPELRTLYLRPTIDDDGAATYEAIGEALPRLTHLQIHFGQDEVPENFNAFAPLFRFKDLVRLHFVAIPCPQLTPSDVMTMAAHWQSLRILDMCSQAVLWEGMQWRMLPSFAAALPNLQKLALPIGGDVPDDPRTSPRFIALQVLGVGLAELTPADISRLSTFLARLCPPGIMIILPKKKESTYDEADPFDFSADPPDSGLHWEEVVRLVRETHALIEAS